MEDRSITSISILEHLDELSREEQAVLGSYLDLWARQISGDVPDATLSEVKVSILSLIRKGVAQIVETDGLMELKIRR